MVNRGGECVESNEKEERVHGDLHDAEGFGTPEEDHRSVNERMEA